MNLTVLTFLGLSIVAIFAALMMLLSKNPVKSILWLIVVFFCISGHYIMLNAQFLAVVNVIVYAGAIMVLFLFVVMMINLNKDSEAVKNYRLQFIGIISGGCLMLILMSAIMSANYHQPVLTKTGESGLIQQLGSALFNNYVLPFEISSVLFLSAMIGAVIIGKKN